MNRRRLRPPVSSGQSFHHGNWMHNLPKRAGFGKSTAMTDRASQVLRLLLDAPFVTLEPGFTVEARTSYGVHGESDDLAVSVEWRDAEGCFSCPLFGKRSDPRGIGGGHRLNARRCRRQHRVSALSTSDARRVFFVLRNMMNEQAILPGLAHPKRPAAVLWFSALGQPRRNGKTTSSSWMTAPHTSGTGSCFHSLLIWFGNTLPNLG